ncbi:hypothetical protein [Flavobacterium sp.]|uniref:ORC-CDC6 family AAA ATPase n=1 Tax=Flavobacterium sp. TaxID=239 RepID=UPI0039E266B7
MSSKLRNPFKIRASEKIDSDDGFIRLFSPLVLESLNEKFLSGKLWNDVLYIHSSPGAGKSSLIRIFEPSCLKILLNSKSAPDLIELFTFLKKIDAITNHKIEVLGVTIPCTRSYEILEELNINDRQKNRLFFSLLNSRFTLSTLRNICTFTNKKFPDELHEIEFSYNNSENYFKDDLPTNGKLLYDWASKIERNIYKAIDSFLPLEDNEIEGHDELFSLIALTPENITLSGNQICTRFLFMLDDAHKLSSSQRKHLKQYLAEKRGNFSIWISERLEALDALENIGSYLERDYNEIDLENFWRKHPGKFDRILRSISDKRASISTEDISSFQSYLNNNLNEEKYTESLTKYIDNKLASFADIAQYTNKFDDWFEYARNFSGTEYQKALLLSEIEIIVHRNLGKQQLTFEFPLAVEEFSVKVSSDVTAAALLFLSKEINMPYYFGFSNLVKASSSNIEQFLSFSGTLFEEMLSKKISGENVSIDDSEQQKILHNIVQQKWKELRRLIPFADQTINFLNALGEFAKKETFKQNAPYSPGVNGFAIKPVNDARLIPEAIWTENEIYLPLVNVLSACVAYNLLEIVTTNQGKKGQIWHVYYLNRWLCIYFGLPLTYGGWRHKTPNDLIKWLKK